MDIILFDVPRFPMPLPPSYIDIRGEDKSIFPTNPGRFFISEKGPRAPGKNAGGHTF